MHELQIEGNIIYKELETLRKQTKGIVLDVDIANVRIELLPAWKRSLMIMHAMSERNDFLQARFYQNPLESIPVLSDNIPQGHLIRNWPTKVIIPSKEDFSNANELTYLIW